MENSQKRHISLREGKGSEERQLWDEGNSQVESSLGSIAFAALLLLSTELEV